MKKLILIFLLLYIGLEVKSQNNNLSLPVSYFYYSYDSTGNRIRRELIVIYPSPPAPNSHNNNDSTGNYGSKNNTELSKFENLNGSAIQNDANYKHETFLGESKITICPNPTKGELRIDITNFNIESKGIITITDFQGRLIKEINQISSTTFMNISNITRGSYILKIVLDGMSKEWVVVKE